jgi:hypothetical protein
VHKESATQNAERAVAKLPGVEKVVNTIKSLPSSRRDDEGVVDSDSDAAWFFRALHA